jgi:hypothetical protein
MNAQSHASGGRVHVLLRNTWAWGREPAGFRHDERGINADTIIKSEYFHLALQSFVYTVVLYVFVIKCVKIINDIFMRI